MYYRGQTLRFSSLPQLSAKYAGVKGVFTVCACDKFVGGRGVFSLLLIDGPRQPKTDEVHVGQPPSALGDLRIAAAPPFLFESPCGTPQFLRQAVIVAAARDVHFTRSGPLWIHHGLACGSIGVSSGTVEIEDPLANIARHVIQAPGIGFFRGYGMGLPVGVFIIPCPVSHLLRIMAGGEHIRSACPGGVFPLGFGGQAIFLPCFFRKPLAKGLHIVPRHPHCRMSFWVTHRQFAEDGRWSCNSVYIFDSQHDFLMHHLGAVCLLIVRKKKLERRLRRAKIKRIDAHTAPQSFVVLPTGFVFGASHHELAAVNEEHIKAYLLAVFGCKGLSVLFHGFGWRGERAGRHRRKAHNVCNHIYRCSFHILRLKSFL